MPRALRAVWAAIAPTRDAVPYVLTTLSSYLMFVAFVATAVAKVPVFRNLEDIDFWPGHWLAACAPDAFVFSILATIFSVLESKSRWLAFATIPIALVLATLAVINAIYLMMTGEQLSAQVVQLGIERFDDVTTMARASTGFGIRHLVGGIAITSIPFAITAAALRRKQRPIGVAAEAGNRARLHLSTALVAMLVVLVTPTPIQFGRLYRNAVLHTTVDLAIGERSWNGGIGLFAGYHRELVDDATRERLLTGPRPNIVVIVLESTRRDGTSLGGKPNVAETPNLVALAARGLEVTHGRAVIPYTTKSLWSMMCGRLPLLQAKIYEASPSIGAECLPDLLASAGWRTGYMQSATARFEDRPRLVHEIGFREIMMAEQYTPLVLGYLSTDDEALVEQLARWIDRAPEKKPFMVAMLTSATHHPYMLTPQARERAKASGKPTRSDRDRYDRQVEAEDHMIGGAIEVLRARGLLDNTIVVVVGDHGEGFGEKAVRQHALNYYEEGLRVPWVMAGPGIPVGRVDDNATLPDLVPTLLDAIGAELSPGALADTPARSLLRPVDRDRVLIFSCLFDKTCHGFVRGTHKVVYVPESGDIFAFDLAADPDERSPQRPSQELLGVAAEVRRTVELHRSKSWPRTYPLILDYLPWVCPAGAPCGIPTVAEVPPP